MEIGDKVTIIRRSETPKLNGLEYSDLIVYKDKTYIYTKKYGRFWYRKKGMEDLTNYFGKIIQIKNDIKVQVDIAIKRIKIKQSLGIDISKGDVLKLKEILGLDINCTI